MGPENTKKTLADETDQLVHQILESGVDCITAGFPCQDISSANRRVGGCAGLSGERSGLFWELADTIRLVATITGRKPLVVLENVAALFGRERQADMGAILSTVAGIGYNIEWDCVAASTVGAPHHRARAYILAHNCSDRRERHFPQKISWQPEFSKFKGFRSAQDLRDRPDIFGRLICRSIPGLAKRLHGIGNGNPPAVMREIMKQLHTTKG